MKRRCFFLSAIAVVSAPGGAEPHNTAIVVSSNKPEADTATTDRLAEALRSRGVAVVDPSSITTTYEERVALVGAIVGPVIAMAASRTSWIEMHYHSNRLLAVRFDYHDIALPYGEFTVHRVKATCSYRCFAVRDKSIIKAGQSRAESRSEDAEEALLQATNQAILGMATEASRALRG